MGYSMPLVCKEMYLPISENDELTLGEYQKKYGIDLKPYLKIINDNLVFDFPKLTKVFIVNMSNYAPYPSVSDINYIQREGTILILGYGTVQQDYAIGLEFSITSVEDPIETVTIRPYTI